jgi:hypothetical protein
LRIFEVVSDLPFGETRSVKCVLYYTQFTQLVKSFGRLSDFLFQPFPALFFDQPLNYTHFTLFVKRLLGPIWKFVLLDFRFFSGRLRLLFFLQPTNYTYFLRLVKRLCRPTWKFVFLDFRSFSGRLPPLFFLQDGRLYAFRAAYQGILEYF